MDILINLSQHNGLTLDQYSLIEQSTQLNTLYNVKLNVRYALKEHGEFAEMHQTDLSSYHRYSNRIFTQ